MIAILIVEDDIQLAKTFQRFLKGAGYQADLAEDYSSGKHLLISGSYSAVFLDINLKDKLTGIDLLKEIREINMNTPVIIMTGAPEVATAADAVRNAAFDYLCKPIEKELLLKVAQAAVNQKTLNDERARQIRNLETAFNQVRNAIATMEPERSYTSLSSGQHSDTLSPIIPESLLSKRENTVLSMLGDGDSNVDIASHLSISTRTVESYYARIISKLNLDGMKALRRYAIKNKQK